MERKYTPEKYFMSFLLVSAVFGFIFPGKILITEPYVYLGSLIALFGASLNLWAGIHFRKRKTAVRHGKKASSLLRGGPFAMSRNPMYLGMTMILLGAAIFFGSLTSFLFPLLFIMLMECRFIPEEEMSLERTFGEKYKNYARRTRKWI